MTTKDNPYTWERLARALRVTLEQFELDLSQIGAQQRLSYEEFEEIFYHLFLVHDPQDTKRRFKWVASARNPQERSRFFELVVGYINDKHLTPHRVTASHLRTLGGEPFRRILGELIRVACDAEVERSSNSPQLPIEDEANLSRDQLNMILAQRIEHEMEQGRKTMQEFGEKKTDLEQLETKVDNSDSEIQSIWMGLARRAGLPNDSLPWEPASRAALRKSLLSRLGAVHARTRVAQEKVLAIELPPVAASTTSDSAVSKRLSQFIRETAKKFDNNNSSQDLEEDENHQLRVNEQLRQQLREYDQRMSELADLWRAEEERLDEEMLKDPRMRARFEELENLFRIPDLIVSPDAPLPTFESIREILADYPDETCDDEKVLQMTRVVFSK